jgi:glycerophosphoryl diester phosphodiesterase
MTKIIGHRGAAGIAFENTISAFKLAQELGVDALEFDVQRTKDGQFVVCHDNRLGRVSKTTAAISAITYSELQGIPLRSGEYVPLLSDVLKVAGNTPVIIEIKISGYTEGVCKVIDEFPQAHVTYASDRTDVIAECRKLRPTTPAFLVQRYQILTAVHSAKAINATGIDLNYKLLNPLTYWFCKRSHLQIMVYTVDNHFAVWILRKLYPRVWICTNHPQRFITAHNDYKSNTTPHHARSIRP